MAGTKPDSSWICTQCDLKYDDDKDQSWLECSCCFKKFDSVCQKINKTTYNALGREDSLWVCPLCLPIWKLFKSQNKVNLRDVMLTDDSTKESLDYLKTTTTNIMTQQANIEKIMKEIETKMATKNDSMEKIGEKISKEVCDKISKEVEGVSTTVKTTVEKDVPKLWSEVIKSSNQSNPSQPVDVINQVKRAMYELEESKKEQEVRSRGIVVYKLPEEENETREGRVAEDKEIMEELCNFLGVEAEILYAERLGKFDVTRCRDNKHRPIKVRFSDQGQRDNILRNLHKLRNAPEHLKKLSIRQDLNDMQRSELRKWTDEAFHRSRLSATKNFRVRGGPGNYWIVELEKKYPNSFNATAL